jgi:hypothetical protein
MRKILFTLFFLIITCTNYACSICGAGASNMYMGLYPNYKKSFLCIRHNYEAYNTYLLNDTTQFSHNFYNTTEVLLGSNIGKRLQVLAVIPYRSLLQNHDDGRFGKSGLGDISISVNYKLFNTTLSSRVQGRLSQELWMGLGLKLPTGFSNIDFTDSTIKLADINTQIGSGSNSVLFNLRHSMELDGFGLNTTADWKLGLTNSQGYKYGSVFTLTTTEYYRFNIRNVAITPSAGLIYEKVSGNSLNGSKVFLKEGINQGSYETGGYAYGLIGGLQIGYKNFIIGASIESPIQQEFAKGQTNLLVKGNAYVTITL